MKKPGAQAGLFLLLSELLINSVLGTKLTVGAPFNLLLVEWGSFRNYTEPVPWSLKRFHQSGQSHFVTFSCFERRPFLVTKRSRQIFEEALERIRRTYRLYVYGYVIMPEHVHLLVSEPERETLATALKSLKQGVARRLITGDTEHFWHKRYFDLNIRDSRQFAEKLDYVHHNPVARGLCADEDGWPWSSFHHYATGAAGIVEIESEWTANRRDRTAGKLCPAIELPHSSQKKA